MSALVLAALLLVEVTLPSGHYVRHCREARDGCELYIEDLATAIVAAAEHYELDPLLLAAVARNESGLSPSAVGPRGSTGAFQLNPRRADARHAETLEEEAFVAAGILSRAIVNCGSLEAGLAQYNSGRCDGPARYARNVLRVRARLASRLMRDGAR